MLNNNLFVSYEISLKLKEKGFNEPCLCTYNNGNLSRNPSHGMDTRPITGEPYTWDNENVHNSVITAPIYCQVIDWLREKHNLVIECKVGYPVKYTHRVINTRKTTEGYNINGPIICIENYYESLNKAIEQALKLI